MAVPISPSCNACSAGKNYDLPKNIRLKGKQAFQALFSSGKRLQKGNLIIISLLSEEPSVGFVASKRVGGAVQRNRAKRLLREAYRMNKKLFSGHQVLFYASGPIHHSDIQRALILYKEHA